MANNPTPYHISLFSLTVGGKALAEPGMIAPLSTRRWTINGSGPVTWRAINDFGGVTDSAQQ